MFKEVDEDIAGDCFQQYFVGIERQLILETNNCLSAVFACIAAHYIFNLHYDKKCCEFWQFIQEKVLKLPAIANSKKSPTISAHFSGIKRYMDSSKED